MCFSVVVRQMLGVINWSCRAHPDPSILRAVMLKPWGPDPLRPQKSDDFPHPPWSILDQRNCACHTSSNSRIILAWWPTKSTCRHHHLIFLRTPTHRSYLATNLDGSIPNTQERRQGTSKTRVVDGLLLVDKRCLIINNNQYKLVTPSAI